MVRDTIGKILFLKDRRVDENTFEESVRIEYECKGITTRIKERDGGFVISYFSFSSSRISQCVIGHMHKDFWLTLSDDGNLEWVI